MQQKERISIFWFRRDLRLDDNHGLYKALCSGIPVLPVFIFDENILDKLSDTADKRVSIIYQALENLQNSLQQLNTSLYTIKGTPVAAFKELLTQFNVVEVYANEDYESYAVKRDKEIHEQLNASGISFHLFKDQVIFDKAEIIKSDGNPYTVFTAYARQWKNSYKEGLAFPSEDHLQNIYRHNHQLPLLNDIGFRKADVTIPALRTDSITDYHLNRNDLHKEGTSNAGIHLRYGLISVRKLIAMAVRANEQYLNELIWREFFKMILWHFPHVEKENYNKRFTVELRNKEDEFHLWREGRTGYAIVDAAMRQLNETGCMHNRLRMITASFLTKHLLIDWRWGEAWFAEKLLDYDLSSNNGNWQWVAGCGCDAAPYFRIFNPEVQQKKFDPEYQYIKKWLPSFNSKNYSPMVEHAFARKRALDAYSRSDR